ncbi:hypothetical protein OSB04_un000473 [Centaurea solstitialis]|uniref:Integrase catalytic domain-containing protein n=1 Tax=Centaurea solstitialis TaxID=347529 RepID=A0AA38S519_9ASTR|nr:hypothetical protein OSB04_un000473 [Centaurea solstitialis]
MTDSVTLLEAKVCELERDLQMEKSLVTKFRNDSDVYKSSLEDMTLCYNREVLESGIRETNLANKMLSLQNSHDELNSSHGELKLKFQLLSEERTKLFTRIKELEDNNFKRGQSEQTLSILTMHANNNPFYHAKPGLGHVENHVLDKAPSNLYNFDDMAASKPKPAFVGGHVTEEFVRQTDTFSEVINVRPSQEPPAYQIVPLAVLPPVPLPKDPSSHLPETQLLDNLINTLGKDLLEANAERIRLSSECETGNSSFTVFKIKFTNLQKQLIVQKVLYEMEKEFFYEKEMMYVQTFANQDVSIARIEYEVKVFLDLGDDPSGFIPKKKKSVPFKPEKSTESQASGSEKNIPKDEKGAGTDKETSVKPHTPKGLQNQNSNSKDARASVKPIKGFDFNSSTFEVGENSQVKPNQPLTSTKPNFSKSSSGKGGKSISTKPSSNSHHALNADGRRNDGGKNSKPPGSDHQGRNNQFTAFPKRHGPSHAGSGHAPPSVGVYSNMSVNRNLNLNNVFNAFKNDMCSMFDNLLRNGVTDYFHAYNSNVNSRKRKGKKRGNSNSSSSVKSPAPKEQSKKGTAPKAVTAPNPKVSHVWYIDSGAYRHMAGHMSFLFNHIESFEGYIKTANRTPKRIMGYRSITDGRYIIKDVRYVEGLGYNMFSSSPFCDNGYWVKQFLYESSVNDDDGNVILSAQRTGNLYTTVFRSIPQTHAQFEALSQSVDAICLLTKASKEDSWLWHRRLCYQNFKDVNKLVSKRLVSGLRETRLSKDTLCSACEQGKMKRSSHPPKMETNCKNPLDMIHMDLCGPMRVERLARKKYMLVLVDEFSRFTWLEFLRAKFDAADRIIAFIKQIQILLGHKVKKLRSDNSTEFRNAKLQSFLEDVGISHNFSVVHTPQQNGVVERKNRTLVEAARSMMAHSGVPQSF